MLTAEKPMWQQDALEHPFVPPLLPAGYVALTDAVPLLSVHDGRWIVRVFHPESGTEGVLLYEDDVEIAHLIAEEVVALVSYIAREAEPLLAICDSSLRATHEQTVMALRSLGRMEEVRKARAVLASLTSTQEQEDQQA